MSHKTTYRALLYKATQDLKSKGIETAALDARLLLCDCFHLSIENLIMHLDEEAHEASAFQEMIERRMMFEPVAKIIGKKEFYGRLFYTSADTLDPRPDSEILIEQILKQAQFMAEKPLKILDCGTGTGCLIITLLLEFGARATGYAIDISEKALEVAQKNAQAFGLQDRLHLTRMDFSDLGQLDGQAFDIIISNPPYIARDERESLMLDVQKFEPELALFADNDGLAAYEVLAPHFKGLLKKEGIGAVEIGASQADAVTTIFKQAGFENVSHAHDLAGRARVVTVF